MDGEGTGLLRHSRLDQALQSLDESSRHLMTLWLAGKSHEEIAADLGLTERDLAGLLADATRLLRARISALDPPSATVWPRPSAP